MKRNPLHLLLVEDNDDHAELALRSISEYPFAHQVHHVRDGEQALDYLLRRGTYATPGSSPTPDLILLDLRLPKIDGLQVLHTIKTDQFLKRIPVIILTTSEADKDMASAYDLHANSYLVKPANFDTFQALIKDLGLFWLIWNKRLPIRTQLNE